MPSMMLLKDSVDKVEKYFAVGHRKKKEAYKAWNLAVRG